MSTDFVDESGATRLRGTITGLPASGIPQGGPLTQDLTAGGHSIVALVGVTGDAGGALRLTGAQGAAQAASSVAVNDAALGVTVSPGVSNAAGPNRSGGAVVVAAANGSGNGVGSSVSLLAGSSGPGGAGAELRIKGGDVGGNNGRVQIITDNTQPEPGLALVGTTDNHNVYGGVIVAAGVPVGAPNGSLPFAVDTTAVTGGLYVWNSTTVTWVKVSALP